MRFFLPHQLTEFEYFEQKETVSLDDDVAKSYREALDFAFFVVNFGYSKSDYLSLTPAEKILIFKAYEEKTVSDSTLFQQAVELAVCNSLRGKNKKRAKLWKKRNKELRNFEEMKRMREEVLEAEEMQGHGWMDKVFEGAGLRRPKD